MVVKLACFCYCDSAEGIHSEFMNKVENDGIKAEDLTGLSVKEVDKRLENLPRDIALEIKRRRRTIKNRE